MVVVVIMVVMTVPPRPVFVLLIRIATRIVRVRPVGLDFPLIVVDGFVVAPHIAAATLVVRMVRRAPRESDRRAPCNSDHHRETKFGSIPSHVPASAVGKSPRASKARLGLLPDMRE